MEIRIHFNVKNKGYQDMTGKHLSPIGDLLFNTYYPGHGALFHSQVALNDTILSDPSLHKRHGKKVKSVQSIISNIAKGTDRVSPNTQVDLEHAIRQRLKTDPNLAQQVVDRMYALTHNDAQHLRKNRGFRVGRGAARPTLG